MNHQDSTGKPIKVGDRVRYGGAEYVVETLGLTNTSGDPAMTLLGLSFPVAEYSVDLVTETPAPLMSIDCGTPRCSGILHTTGPDGVNRCLPCLFAYREGMAQVATMGPFEADTVLAALNTLLGPREERDRPRRVEVEAREVILAENFAKQTGFSVDVALAKALIPPSMSDALERAVKSEPMRRCANGACNAILPRDWPAVYCSNGCALDDA